MATNANITRVTTGLDPNADLTFAPLRTITDNALTARWYGDKAPSAKELHAIAASNPDAIWAKDGTFKPGVIQTQVMKPESTLKTNAVEHVSIQAAATRSGVFRPAPGTHQPVFNPQRQTTAPIADNKSNVHTPPTSVFGSLINNG